MGGLSRARTWRSTERASTGIEIHRVKPLALAGHESGGWRALFGKQGTKEERDER
jgi:hypothetical protein